MSDFEIIESALRKTGLGSFLNAFKEERVDDEILDGFENHNEIQELIPKLGDRAKFYKEFKLLYNKNEVPEQVVLIKQNPKPKSKQIQKIVQTTPKNELHFLEIVQESSENPKARLNLYTQNLAKIFEQIGHKKVALLSISGDSKGKSYFLSNILKFFQNSRNKDWFGYANTSKPLDGFSPWCPIDQKIDFENPALSIFSKHFNIVDKNGREFVLFLIDSQHFQNLDEESRILSKILLLISSTFIQLTNDLENVHLLENLNFHKEFKEFSSENFTILLQGRQKKFGLNVIEINDEFEEYEVFSIPELEEKFKSNEAFNGSIDGFSAKFSNKLMEFVEFIGSPENIPMKSFKSKYLTGFEVKELIEKYTEFLNESNLNFGEILEKIKNLNLTPVPEVVPEQSSSSEANVKIDMNKLLSENSENRENVHVDLDKFVEKFKKILSSKNLNFFMTETQLDDVVEEVEGEIKDKFVGKFKDDSKNFKTLAQKLSFVSKKYKKESLEKKKSFESSISEKIDLGMKMFENELNLEIMKYTFVSNQFFNNELYTKADKVFSKYFPNEKSSHFPLFEKEISKKMKATLDKLNSKNQGILELYEKKIQEFSQKSYDQFEREMKNIALSSVEENSSLENEFEILKKDIVENFSKHKIFENLEESRGDFVKKLNDTIEECFKANRKMYLEFQENREKDLKLFLKNSIEIYQKQMTDFLGLGFYEVKELEGLHNISLQEATDVLKGSYSEQGGKISENVLEKLEKKCEKAFSQFRRQNEENKIKAENEAEKSVTTYSRKYEDQMMHNTTSRFLKGKMLQNLHETTREQIVAEFKSTCPGGIKINDILGKLDEAIDRVFRNIKELNLLRKEEQESTKNKIEKCLLDYDKEMEKFFENKSFVKPDELLKVHRNLSARLVRSAEEDYNLDAEKKNYLSQNIQARYVYFDHMNILNTPKNPAVGIDLGTTYSCIGIYSNNKLEILENRIGAQTTPSYVGFTPGSVREKVGDPAKSDAFRDPENTIYDSKRLIGKNFSDPNVQAFFQYWPFTVIQGNNDTPLISLREINKEYRPEEISSMILKEMKNVANEYLGKDENYKLDAVITVPYYFTERQRRATKDAGDLAGLNVLRIINEPTAAAIAYRLEYSLDKRILVYDLGGGTFDVSLLRIEAGDIVVEAADGDTNLGGQDFDNQMIDHILDQFKIETGVDLKSELNSPDKDRRREAKTCLSRLRGECERKKWEISQVENISINLPKIYMDHNLVMDFSRETFETLNSELFGKTIEIIQRTLDKAEIEIEDINDIVLVGGSTRIPKIRELLRDFFGGRVLTFSHRPDHAVAEGAAILASIINGGGGEKGGKLQDFKVSDVAPHSIGIELENDIFSPIIRQNSKIPTSITKVYSTIEDNQYSALINIYEGESIIAQDNDHLGLFIVEDIPKGPAGKETVEVLMEITNENILNVTAKSRNSSANLSISEYRNKMPRND